MRRNRIAGRGGFTLIEMMIAVGIIGLLATIAIPTLIRLQLRAKASEVKASIAALRVAEEAYSGEYGVYVSALPVVPTSVGPTKTPWTLLTGDPHGFNTLGFRPSGANYFQYGITSDGATAYTVAGRSDIDGDGEYNTWGLVKPAAGTASGVAGPFGTCEASGVYSRAADANVLLEEIGPCDLESLSTEY